MLISKKTHCFRCDGTMSEPRVESLVKIIVRECNKCGAEKWVNGALRTKEQFRCGFWSINYTRQK